MIIIADGGSTKVDWRLVNEGGVVKQIITKGMNPFFRSREDISEEIRTVLMPEIGGELIGSIHFFGAGCVPAKRRVIHGAITDNIKTHTVEVDSDLMAAARGLCGNDEGVACILGTGSNACHYDGTDIIGHVSPLGYILGDEGSGAVLGRMFLNGCLKNQRLENMKKNLFEKYNLNEVDILDKVYEQPMANRFLAGFCPFVYQHLDNEVVYNIVYTAFNDFFVKNVMQFDYDCRNHPVHFTGSVAYYFQEVLRKVAADRNIATGIIVQSPMDGLIRYYSTD